MLIICLSGGSGSGKTTLAKLIASKFPKGFVSILPIDAYYKDHSHLNEEEKRLYNFDHPDAIDFDLLIDHLQKLKMSLPIHRPVYSFLTCSREQACERIEPSEILIVEGLLAMSSEKLKTEAGYTIFLDASEATRLNRIIERDMAERGRSMEMSAERFYSVVQPMHEAYIELHKDSADLIVDGNSNNINAIVRRVVQAIGSHLYKANCQSIDL